MGWVGDPEDGGDVGAMGMGMGMGQGKGECGRLNNAQIRCCCSAHGTCSTTRCSHSIHGARSAQFRSVVIMLGCAVVLASLLACVAGFPAAQNPELGVVGGDLERRDALDDWIAKQEAVAYAGVLDNVGDVGGRSYGAKRGLVLASPSTLDPDCECSIFFLLMR